MTPRVDRRYRVRIRVDCHTRDMFVSNRVTNISRGGVFIESDRPLPIDSESDITLTLPDSERQIETRGRVIWTYDMRKGSSHLVPGMGIKFVDMTSEDRSNLEDYIDKLTRLVQTPIGSSDTPTPRLN